jgi:catechol 2,3-dioxygenase-like lactoylglutathione lyase family enzyme
MSEQIRTRITQVETVAVHVADQHRALKFYLGRLGFERRRDVPFGDGQRWIEVAPAGATTTIALVAPREGGATGIDTGVRLATEDAEADYADLRGRGVGVDGEILHSLGAPPMFAFRDPDGNRLIIVGRG